MIPVNAAAPPAPQPNSTRSASGAGSFVSSVFNPGAPGPAGTSAGTGTGYPQAAAYGGVNMSRLPVGMNNSNDIGVAGNTRKRTRLA